MAAETQYTAQTGLGQVTTANANLDGTTGTYSGTIITGASNGTLLKSITIKAIEDISTDGIVRIFVTGGGSTRLIEEINVNAQSKSATYPAFEVTINVNHIIASGYTVKASTSITKNINVIIEALDWAYYASSVRPESTNYTASTGMVLINTANTNLDGSGTLGTVITAGVSGSGWKGLKVESISITAVAFATGTATTPGMVRFYLYDGSSVTRLITEVMVPAVAQASNQKTFNTKINLGNFQLQAGYSIKASTEKGDSFAIIAECNDWKYPA